MDGGTMNFSIHHAVLSLSCACALLAGSACKQAPSAAKSSPAVDPGGDDFALISYNTRLYHAAKPDTASFKASSAALKPRAYVVKVLERGEEFWRVEYDPDQSVESHCFETMRFLSNMRLEFWVKPAELVHVIPEDTRFEFEDGTSIDVMAGAATDEAGSELYTGRIQLKGGPTWPSARTYKVGSGRPKAAKKPLDYTGTFSLDGKPLRLGSLASEDELEGSEGLLSGVTTCASLKVKASGASSMRSVGMANGNNARQASHTVCEGSPVYTSEGVELGEVVRAHTLSLEGTEERGGRVCERFHDQPQERDAFTVWLCFDRDNVRDNQEAGKDPCGAS